MLLQMGKLCSFKRNSLETEDKKLAAAEKILNLKRYIHLISLIATK